MICNHKYSSGSIKTFLLFFFTSCLLLSCNMMGEEEKNKGAFSIPEGLDKETELKFRQYAVQGRLLYEQHCANCHKEDGTGLGTLIPPLAQSDYLLNNPDQAMCIMRHGMEGPVVVNGKEYNQPMPANNQLRDIEIAEIATYILNSWGNKGRLIPVQEAREVLNNCPQIR